MRVVFHRGTGPTGDSLTVEFPGFQLRNEPHGHRWPVIAHEMRVPAYPGLFAVRLPPGKAWQGRCVEPRYIPAEILVLSTGTQCRGGHTGEFYADIVLRIPLANSKRIYTP